MPLRRVVHYYPLVFWDTAQGHSSAYIVLCMTRGANAKRHGFAGNVPSFVFLVKLLLSTQGSPKALKRAVLKPRHLMIVWIHTSSM
jgi:hypothetical protein